MFCVFCGEKKRLTWPEYDKSACSQKCAARAALLDYRAGPDKYHCPDCGDMGCDGECTEKDEWKASYSIFKN